MSRLCRLKTKTHGEDGQWAYKEITTLRQRVAELERERVDCGKLGLDLCEQFKQLTAERDALLEANRIACEDLVELHDRISELKQQRDELISIPDDVVRDAKRYRWLRNSGKGDDLIRYDCRGVYLPESSALDTAIDTAMEKQ